MTKKKLQKIFKRISYSLFSLLYGRIEKSISFKSDDRINHKQVIKSKNLEYKIYTIQNGRLYTDRVQDTAIILDKSIVEGPSFQYRKNVNSSVSENVVFKKGTPRILKKVKGKVLSLLTGGAGNDNYWHWLFDVLPRLSIIKDLMKINEVDYFLLPSLKIKFQKESLLELGINSDKLLSSEKFRHIKCNQLIATDHPYSNSDNPSRDIHNIPKWISIWLKENFANKAKNNEKRKSLPKKFYIDRSDSISNVAKLRSIINEEEIKSFLKNDGFTSIRLSDLHFLDQVRLFNEAEYIVGLHGAAFANMVFCNSKTKILELRNNTTADKVIESLAINNNLNFNCIKCEPLASNYSNQFGHIEIPLNILKEKIKNL